MVETAQTIKKSVEEGKIDGIIDKACCFFGLFDKFGSRQKSSYLEFQRFYVLTAICSTYKIIMTWQYEIINPDDKVTKW